VKVVVVVGIFGDAQHVPELASSVDLVVYGTRFRTNFYEPEPPAECASRVFRPLVPTARGHQLWVYPGLFRALDEDCPDVVHVVSEAWGTLPVQVLVWARRHPETAVIVHAADRIWWHGSRAEIAAKRMLARAVLGRLQGFAGLTESVIDIARTAGLPGSVPTEAVHHNPRDPRLFRPPTDEGERADARRRLGLPVNGRGIGFLARLSPEKGPLPFLDAIRLARPRLGDAWVAMGGAGPLEKEVAERARAENVRMLGRVPFPDGAADFYRAVDVHVVPSVRTHDSEDQSPRSVIEAMMSACVVVGSDCGPIPDMVGDAGIITRQGDPGDLADGIVAGLASAADHDLRSRARRRALDHYSPEAVARSMLALWRRALDAREGVSSLPRPPASAWWRAR
jgi:glycosyltransferase involved in cell wall biosynthesis